MGYGNPDDANARIRGFLGLDTDTGHLGVSVALDLPTQVGLDPDNEQSKGEVGRLGVSIFCADDITALFSGIPIDRVAYVSTTANAIGPVYTAMHIVGLRRLGLDPSATRLFIQNDVLKEYDARGTYVVPVEAGLKLSCDVAEHVIRKFPTWSPLMVCSYHFREAGIVDAATEVGLGISDMLAYVDELVSRGLDLNSIVSSMRYHPVSAIDLFEEIAKHRAMRRIWARTVKERYKTDDPRAYRIRTLTATSGAGLARSEPMNNIARITIAALGAYLGGADEVSCRTYDEAYSIPTAAAQKVSVRIQQIIEHESGIITPDDPLGGSYYIEWLTAEIEERAQRVIEKIQEQGGAVQAIDRGYYRRLIEEGLGRFHKEMDSGMRTIVGLGSQDESGLNEVKIQGYTRAIEKRSVERLAGLKKKRDNALVKNSLERLEKALSREENLMLAMIGAASSSATLGEVCEVLRDHYGGQSRI